MLGTGKDYWEPINPYLIRYLIRDIPLHYYFWISIAATCIFLALTSVVAFRKLSDPHLFWRIDKLEESIADNAETINSAQTSLHLDLENNKRAREEFMGKINTTLADTRKDTLSTLKKHERAIQATNKNFHKTTKEMMSKLEEEQANSIQQMNMTLEKSTKETHNLLEKAMSQQMAQIRETTKRVESLEQELFPQPRLTSQNRPEDVKGIGPQLARDLRALGITNVAELIIADPRAVAQETRVTRETIKRLQTITQLQMIPGVEENHAELLEEVGIATRQYLARQDPIQLSRRIETIANSFIEQGKLAESEKPTFEEIVSWIRRAKV
jgi:predicted flap endonuclease-1-like 5' DNA nuclease